MIKFLDFLQKEIESGKSLTKALQEQNIVKLPQYVIHSINVAENSGNLDLVMIELSKFIQDEEKINSKASQAMIYPVFILSISFVLLIVMLTTVVPKIVKIFNSLNRKLPKITQIVINTSDFVKNNYVFIIVFTISFIIIFKIIYTKNKKFKLLIHSLFLKLPIINRLIITKELSRFSYMTYTLTKSGINFINAINLAANTIQNEKIKQIFIKALNEVKEGKSFSISLKKYNFPDKSFVESLALAEETGEIKEIMKNLNEIYFEEYQNKTSTLLSLLEPAMMLIVGGIIGFIVTAMLLPIFNMNMIH
jgi:general secretion pathway protein F/type IV pilus assembly protein PilC